jgi:hypothetical protein
MSAANGTCESRWADANAMETVFTGYVTLDVAQSGYVAAFALLGDRAVHYWTIDVSAITGFEASIRSAGFRWMKDFRSRGGQRMFVVTASSAVRMMGSALAFATGMPVSFVPSREHAAKRIAMAGGHGA